MPGYRGGLAAMLLACAPFSARAQPVPPEKNALTFQFENDLFYSADHDYTNGAALSYTTAPDETPDWAKDMAYALPIFTKAGAIRTRYAIGQSMFTPRNLSLVNPPLSDRPYAGFLYGSLGVFADSGRHLDQLQLTLGIIGPDSLGEETQKFVHRIVNSPDPKGWGTQLHDEPGLILEYQRSYRIIKPQSVWGAIFDIEPHYGAAIGNVYDYFNAGAMARFGFNLPDDYGPARIQPSLPGSDFYEPAGDIGAYIFAGVDGRAIARNLFLDGNSFGTSRSVSKMNLVGDITLGAALTFDAFRLAYTHVIRSREYRTQAAASEFGAISLTVRF